MLTATTLCLALFVGITLVAHLLSTVLACRHVARSAPSAQNLPIPPVTIIRPVCGCDPALHDTLASSFNTATPSEVLFCVSEPDDPAIDVIASVIASHPQADARLLIGEDAISNNPKLNNLAKGWNAARHDWIALIDSNVLLPQDFVATLFGAWQTDTGLVTSPPAGIKPTTTAARIEAGFLNTYQDRWQLAADQVGLGFAQGKVLFWRRDVLEGAGGLAALGGNLAEDVAATKVVRAAGLCVRLVPSPFPQPLGARSFTEVWQRQIRWARVRRDGFPLIFALEPLSGAAPPVLALSFLCLNLHASPLWVAMLVLLWFGSEWELARRAGWPANAIDMLCWMLRDAMIPAVWAAALGSRCINWRGHDMKPAASARWSHE
ncbi:glycosyltransferase [Tropicimonas sp. IMCC34043]|uniref:glycosyltransferase n=1 Tax=Tropicimonas sp. IMCC34043 TaxID=2248760 RepID=UPI000E22A14C|nr:glycosyltransferase [Tropicimonas sp. IMCC34043]